MKKLKELIFEYLEFGKYQKNLNEKTLKAYQIDLSQFSDYLEKTDMELTRSTILNFTTLLHKKYKPKTVKRKIASLKAFFSHLEYEEILIENPFSKMKIKFQEPFLLPKTISMQNIEKIFTTVYDEFSRNTNTDYRRASVIRDIAVIELLFATGIRVSELSFLKVDNVDLIQGLIKIYGKGSKERVIQITNLEVLDSLNRYHELFKSQIKLSGFFFINRLNYRLSEQSVRFMINKYVNLSGLTTHITPHMFRHTLATLLLEEDVDIRYIQSLLGHSSILTTQIYTHVTTNKQRDIFISKHPRNKINF